MVKKEYERRKKQCVKSERCEERNAAARKKGEWKIEEKDDESSQTNVGRRHFKLRRR